MTSPVAGALKLVALVMVVAMLVGASFLRSRDRKDPVVEVIELSGSAPSTTTTTEELPTVEVPIEVAPPSVHIPPSVEADDDGAIDVVPSNPDDPFHDDDGADRDHDGNDDEGSDDEDGGDDGEDSLTGRS